MTRTGTTRGGGQARPQCLMPAERQEAHTRDTSGLASPCLRTPLVRTTILHTSVHLHTSSVRLPPSLYAFEILVCVPDTSSEHLNSWSTRLVISLDSMNTAHVLPTPLCTRFLHLLYAHRAPDSCERRGLRIEGPAAGTKRNSLEGASSASTTETCNGNIVIMSSLHRQARPLRFHGASGTTMEADTSTACVLQKRLLRNRAFRRCR